MRYAVSVGFLIVVITFSAPVKATWLDPVADPTIVVAKDAADGRFGFVNGPVGQSEWLLNYGTSGSTRMKGNQDVTVLKWNLAAHKGKTVVDAELHLCRANTQPIHAMVAATICADWPEGTKSGGTAGTGDSCWRWRSRASNDANATLANEWTYSHSDFASASFGNNGSLVSYGYLYNDTYNSYSDGTYTWIRMKLDPAVASALVLDQYGLMVTDPRGYLTSYNPTVYTKNQNATVQPKLYIKFAATPDTTPPGEVGGLSAASGPENGEVVLSFAAPTDESGKAFGYTVRYSAGSDFTTASDVARWRIPRPATTGTAQKILIEDLAPGATYNLWVQPYDATGNPGAARSVSFTLPAAWSTPVLADGRFAAPDPDGKAIRTVAGVLRYWAASEVAKINPATGNRYDDGYTGSAADDYKKANPVWDAGTNTISLSACRNEVVGCQVILERIPDSLTNVGVSVSDLVGPGGMTIPADPYIELFQLHYVKAVNQSTGAYLGYYMPDAAIPLSSPFATSFDIPDTNRNPGGVNQGVWIDLYVPKYTGLPTSQAPVVPGDYSGTIVISAAQLSGPVTISLKVRVSPVTMPDENSFIADLNGYGGKWDVGTSPYYNSCTRYFQICHKHRVVPNLLPYGWNGSVSPSERKPSLTGSGTGLHASSWSSFDAKYDRFFSTSPAVSAFSRTYSMPYYGPGENVPVTHFYTCFNDSWPVAMSSTSLGYDPTSPVLPGLPGKGHAYYNNLLDSGVTASEDTAFNEMPDVMAAFPDGFRQGNRNVVADWFLHAQAKGWTKTAFEIYHNNKWNYTNCNSLWTLEECDVADDFRALGFFHQLYRDGQAAASAPDVKWHFRIDISDRWGQNYGQLNDRINLYNMGSGAAAWYWPSMEYRNYQMSQPEQWWWYGGGQGIDATGMNPARVYLQRWSQGFGGGMLYWDHFQTSWKDGNSVSHNAWVDGGNLCSVYSGAAVPGQTGTWEGPILSPRVKQMRQAQQVIEMLNLWAGTAGMNRQKVRASVNSKYGDMTWDYAFGGLDENDLYKLRADLQAELESLLFLVGDIDGDGSVDVVDLLYLADAFGSMAGDPTYNSTSDFNNDGSVDVVDLLMLAENFGRLLE
jgi:hypothetical protein